MLRFSIAVAVFTTFAAPTVWAFTPEQLDLEFDARLLTVDEKRFLQLGLAFATTYNGLLDGAWGAGSQRAFEKYEVRNGRTEFVTNTEAVFLAAYTFTALEKAGWQRQYNSTLDMSFLVPTIGFIAGVPSETFANFELAGTSLGYSLTIGDENQPPRLHAFTAGQAIGEVYQVRRPALWITSGRNAAGSSLYTRSDYRRGSWSTIMLFASESDAGLLAAVTSSIQPGYASQINLPPGLLSNGIKTVAMILEESTPDGGISPPAEAVTAPPGPPASEPEKERSGGSGTGFLVSTNGDFLTNSHVVSGCSSVSIDGVTAEVVAQDEAFDLALLRVTPAPEASPATFSEKPARLNSDVTVIGYPLLGLLGGINVTRGSVASLKGLAGDGVQMQISAPVQPGNSGGPVVNAAGHVVGVVVSKLDAQLVADAIGDIPQNINFAIRAEIAKLFLYQNGVEPIEADEAEALAPEDLAEAAQSFTRLITCN